MNNAVECLRCRAQMEPGFVPDNTQAGFQEQTMVSGRAGAKLLEGYENEKRLRDSGQNASLSEVWVLGVVCHLTRRIREIARKNILLP